MKDASYHEAAIQYNEELAQFAGELADRLEHEEVQRWSRAVSKQHQFHAGRHKKALSKLESGPTIAPEEAEVPGPRDAGDDILESMADSELAAQQLSAQQENRETA